MKLKFSFIMTLISCILISIVIIYKIYVVCNTYSYDNETYNNYNKNKDNIQFLTKDDVIILFNQDKDNYVKNMSIADLHARHIKNASEYINNIIKCVSEFNEIQMTKLIRCAKKADKFLKDYNYNNSIYSILCEDIASIPWKFALTKKVYNGRDQYTNKELSLEYEEGLPHTRNDVIFLSSYIINDIISIDKHDEHLVSTLIHEKVHIFQRYNPDIVHKIIEKLGFKEYEYHNKLKRCNPDINDKCYVDSNGIPLLILYNSMKPTGINDIKSDNYTMEHPYEKMAYDIANAYTQQNLIDIMKTL